jgi:hypothetical protein
MVPHLAGAPARGADGSPGPSVPLVWPALKGGALHHVYQDLRLKLKRVEKLHDVPCRLGRSP